MKYKVGDRVRIKDNLTGIHFVTMPMKQYEGKNMTVDATGTNYMGHWYRMVENNNYEWYDDMIEGLADSEPEPDPKPKKPTMTEILQLAIDTYGEDEQCRMIQEEMAELAVALNKYHREHCTGRLENVQEEIADVCIMMQQAKMMFGEKDVDKIIRAKTKRLHERLKDEQDVEVVSGKHKINGKTYTWINPDKVKVEIGGIAIADTDKGHAPIIVTSTWPEKLKDVKHHRKIVCGGGLNDE